MSGKGTTVEQLLCVLIALLAEAAPLQAHPYMIRLGYSTCATCHVSPQGGGLLTPYGQGVEGALSLRLHEYDQGDEGKSPRLLYDARALGTGAEISSASVSNVQALLLTSLRVGAHQRLTSTIAVTGPSLAATPAISSRVDVPTAVWEYRPAQGFELMAGRDALPTGLGSPDPQTFIRRGTDPVSIAYPTQVKVFWWTPRWQLTPYAFGPAGNETPANREWGGGSLAGVTVWNQRAVVGVSLMESRTSAFNRRSVGGYARLGLGNKWSVLAEHEVITRAEGVTTGYIAGHTRVIFVPYRWLETWVSTDELVTYTTTNAHTVRLTPGLLLRVSENVQAGFTARDVFTPKGQSRMYSVTFTLKSFN